MKKFFICMIIISAIGCGLPKNLRVAENKNSSVIGISIKTITLTIFKNKPEVVYFVKLDEKDENNLGNKIIPSNYVRGDYAYLVNATPGKYAAIGSFFTQTENSYNTFCDANIIQNTVVDVGPNQIVFVGSLVIENQMKNLYQNIEQNGDRAQLHYYNLLKSFMYGTFYCGAPDRIDKSKEAENNFLLKTKIYFNDTEWVPMIEKRIEGTEEAEK